jgi:hypothetical protein
MYTAEERIWYDGPDEPPTTFYGFFLSHGQWDMPIIPFHNEADRDYTLEVALKNWGLDYPDACRAAALASAWAETESASYLEACVELAGHLVDRDTITKYFDKVCDLVWE